MIELESVTELIDVLGTSAAEVLILAFRGKRLVIPKKENKDQKIITAIGPEAAKVLFFHYGGTEIDIPRYPKFMLLKRNLKIADEFKHGAHLQYLADRYDLSRRRIQQIIKNEYGTMTLVNSRQDY